MLKVLGLIILGLAVFMLVFSVFIASGVLTSRVWQLAAISTAAFISALVVSALSPARIWETVPAVVIGGTMIFLRQGLRHFMDREAKVVLLILLLGMAFGVVGMLVGKAVRRGNQH